MDFKTWWLSEGYKEMPSGDEPPEHAAIAELAWNAALASAPPAPASELELWELVVKWRKLGHERAIEFSLDTTDYSLCADELERVLSLSGQEQP